MYRILAVWMGLVAGGIAVIVVQQLAFGTGPAIGVPLTAGLTLASVPLARRVDRRARRRRGPDPKGADQPGRRLSRSGFPPSV